MHGALPQLLYYLWDLEEQRNGRQEEGFTVRSEFSLKIEPLHSLLLIKSYIHAKN